MTNPFQSVSRPFFAWTMVALIALQVVATALANVVAIPTWGGQAFGIGVVICTALLTGARLVDAGYRRWVGITGVLAIVFVFPVVVTFIAVLVFGVRTSGIMTLAPAVVVALMVTLLAFIVWAGTRPSIAHASREDWHDQFVDGADTDHRQSQRREPRF
jgi:ABC-type transport system involved in cytochrome c biogenesis permease subunit